MRVVLNIPDDEYDTFATEVQAVWDLERHMEQLDKGGPNHDGDYIQIADLQDEQALPAVSVALAVARYIDTRQETA